MTELEKLAQWRALADAATPGPWGYWLHQVGGADWRGQWYLLADVYGSDNMGDEAAKNAAFIAAARAAVPALLAEVERLRSQLNELRTIERTGSMSDRTRAKMTQVWAEGDTA